MHDMIKNLTAEQALEVVKRLTGTGGKIQEAVLAKARAMLSEIDLDETADEVFFVLDSIDVEDCWDRAGSSRDGYTSPDEAAAEIVEETLEPFLDQTRRYHELGMPGEEMTHCMGVILGIYRYEHESKSEFREWSADVPAECAGDWLREWRERGQNPAFAEAMDEFIRKRCPNWAGYLLRTGGRI
jgi:hypothetical protein